ncbi:MAG: 30S ribosomal protein S20 [Tissierellia bacterium]|nr:30S ribosomal protein S20 [Tissierellia bacterium]
MANIKSAKKRVKTIATKTLRNNMIKSAFKTAITKFENAISNNESKDVVIENHKNAVKKIDMALSKGVLKSNTAARKKSTLAKKLNNVK